MSSVTPRPDAPARLELDPGRNCWRVERADRAAVIVDAENYFRIARKAMIAARSQILLMGWDLDTRIQLDEPEGRGKPPNCLGPLITWLARTRPELNIHILAWDGEAYRFVGRGTTMLRLARWRMKKNIEFRLDHSSPLAASHHHKILVIDDKVAFCGGIDMTASRWDTRAHRDHDPGRRRPTTGRRYGPWHDTTMAVDGAAARALGDLARSRWELACGTCLEPAAEGEDPWPRALEPDFRDVPLAIARTRAKAEEWAEIREIEALFVDMIASASRFVYVETQYFASRVVAEAIAKRLAEPDGPEFLIVNPKTGHDWLDEGVMGPARAQLVRVLEKADPGGRFRIYTPVTEKGADIYVHAKLMIVDDVMLRVGSANMNNRSMGLDSECDLLVDSRLCEDPAAGEAIAAIRTGLLAEHLGRRTEEVESCFEETGSLIAAVERLRARKGRTLLPFVPPETNKLQEQLADSEALDPESADQPFEPLAGSRLLARLRRFGRRGG